MVFADNARSGNVPLFIKDTSSFWYKPHISREESKLQICHMTKYFVITEYTNVHHFLLAIKLLHDKPSGTFIIRDSNSFQGAYGLALKVTQTDGNSFIYKL